MQRFLPAIFALLLLAGCGTSPIDTESTREIVLQYLGGQVGTAGPFAAKAAKREADILGEADRRSAEALIDRGAVVFLVNGERAGTTGASRVILVQNNKVVGDYRPQSKPAAQ
jgi:hypothetical protein